MDCFWGPALKSPCWNTSAISPCWNEYYYDFSVRSSLRAGILLRFLRTFVSVLEYVCDFTAPSSLRAGIRLRFHRAFKSPCWNKFAISPCFQVSVLDYFCDFSVPSSLRAGILLRFLRTFKSPCWNTFAISPCVQVSSRYVGPTRLSVCRRALKSSCRNIFAIFPCVLINPSNYVEQLNWYLVTHSADSNFKWDNVQMPKTWLHQTTSESLSKSCLQKLACLFMQVSVGTQYCLYQDFQQCQSCSEVLAVRSGVIS